jgi:NADH dehydrogenase
MNFGSNVKGMTTCWNDQENTTSASARVAAALDGRQPAPFVYHSLGTMASLGHSRAVAQVLGIRLRGFPAWWLRRTYYLLQMPRWDRRLRIVLDWTVALFFRPDITKVDITGP